MRKNTKDLIIVIIAVIFLMMLSFGIGYNFSNPNSFSLTKSDGTFITKLQPSSYFNFDTINNLRTNTNLNLVFNDKFSITRVTPTGSMYPTISDVSTLILAEPKNLKVGDIIYFHCNDSIITHRIILISTGYDGITHYVTKGDNNQHDDTKAFGCQTTIDKIDWKIVGVLY